MSDYDEPDNPEEVAELRAEIERLKADAKESQGWYEAEIERLQAELDRMHRYQGLAGQRADEAEAQLAKVVERHQPVPNGAGDEVCVVCGVYWPCDERRYYDSLGLAVAQPEEEEK